MKFGAALDPELDLDPMFKPKARRGSWGPRSIGRLMGLVALSGLVLAAGSQRLRHQVPARGRLTLAPRGLRVPPQTAPQPVPPFDRAVIPARPGIDEAMIVTARAGIDDAMIVNPGQMRSQGVMVLPPVPAQPNSAPIKLWQPMPRAPRSR